MCCEYIGEPLDASMAKYCTAGSSENVAVDDDTIFPVLFCVVKHKFVGQIEWAWVTHLFSSSVFSYFVLLFSMLSVSFPLHERRATSVYVILVRTSHMTMRMRCYAGPLWRILCIFFRSDFRHHKYKWLFLFVDGSNQITSRRDQFCHLYLVREDEDGVSRCASISLTRCDGSQNEMYNRNDVGRQ